MNSEWQFVHVKSLWPNESFCVFSVLLANETMPIVQLYNVQFSDSDLWQGLQWKLAICIAPPLDTVQIRLG